MKKRLFSVVSAFIMGLSLPAQTTAPGEGVKFVEGKSFREVLNQAKAEGKMVFVDCYTSWCGPCRMMATKEFPKKEAGDYFNAKYVCMKVDMEQGEGPELGKRYDVHAFPTFLFLDADGKLLNLIVGYNKMDEFIPKAEEGLKSGGIVAMIQRYADGERDMGFIKTYLEALDESYMIGKKVQVVCDLTKNKDINELLGDTTLFNMYYAMITSEMERFKVSYKDPTFLMLYRHKADVEKIYGKKKAEGIESFWEVYPMTLFSYDGHTYKGFDQAKMDEYVKVMEEYGVTSRKKVAFQSALNVALFSGNHEKALSMLSDAVLEDLDSGVIMLAANSLMDKAGSQEMRKALKPVVERCIKELDKRGEKTERLVEAAGKL